ncbi:hypothetical protein Tco_0908269 [Tanacetum coccineum]|uniref:Uncharacterized protein n=1 Tax=Tanacetum coccineum TaxID=301880 RepID=A0ABQ5CMR6_9ASTR
MHCERKASGFKEFIWKIVVLVEIHERGGTSSKIEEDPSWWMVVIVVCNSKNVVSLGVEHGDGVLAMDEEGKRGQWRSTVEKEVEDEVNVDEDDIRYLRLNWSMLLYECELVLVYYPKVFYLGDYEYGEMKLEGINRYLHNLAMYGGRLPLNLD